MPQPRPLGGVFFWRYYGGMFPPATTIGLVASLVLTYLLAVCFGWFVDPRVFWAIEWFIILLVVAMSLYRDFRKHPSPRRRKD